MGAVLQTAGAAELVAELTCCAASSVCGLVTRDSATRAKFRYCSFLLLATVTCVIVLIPGLRVKLDKIPHLCDKVVTPETCDKFVGFNAVYRILISMTVFHFLLALLTIRVTRVKSFRARFNNGLWFFKMGLIFGLTIASFYIPRKTNFFRIWMYISLIGGFVFMLFQIILIIDFGHSWSLSWAEKLESGYTKLWYLAMALVTLLMFSISFGALISFYAFFTHPPNFMKCDANVFYITFIGVQCFLAIVVSITPSVQQELAGAGLLQSSVVVMYTMYLTWNTLSSEPDSVCNPLGNVILEYDSLTGISGEAIFGCLLTLILLIFACTVRASTSHLGKYGLALTESEAFAMATYREDTAKSNVETQLETGEKEVSLDEYVGYNYSFFHIIMSLACLHVLMVLTNWHSPEDKSSMKKLVRNWASVWVQMASSFVCILVYVWFLVTPLVKRHWGPSFGVLIDDNVDYPPDHAFRDKKSIATSPLTKTEADDVIVEQPTRADSETLDVNVTRPESRNTFRPTKLRRRGSEESILSAVSANSNVTTSRKVKHKNKLMTVPESEDENRSEVIPKKVIIPPERQETAKQRRKRRLMKRKLEKEAMYSSCESIASRVSTYVKKNIQKLKRTPSLIEEDEVKSTLSRIKSKHSTFIEDNTESEYYRPTSKKDIKISKTVISVPLLQADDESTNRKLKSKRLSSKDEIIREPESLKTIAQNNPQMESKQTSKKLIRQDYLSPDDGVVPNRQIGLEKANILQSNEKHSDRNESHNSSAPRLDETALVPSVFTRKTQNPDTAKEILQLQWKILRAQAKVVKIQERIIKLQTQEEKVPDETRNVPVVAEKYKKKVKSRTKRTKIMKEPG